MSKIQVVIDYDMLKHGADHLCLTNRYNNDELGDKWVTLNDSEGSNVSKNLEEIGKSHGILGKYSNQLNDLEDTAYNIYNEIDCLGENVAYVVEEYMDAEEKISSKNELNTILNAMGTKLGLGKNYSSNWSENKFDEFKIYKHSYNFEDKMNKDTYDKTYNNLKELLEDKTGATVSKEMADSWYDRANYKTHQKQFEAYKQEFLDQGYDEKTAESLAKFKIRKEAMKETGAETVDGYTESELSTRYSNLKNQPHDPVEDPVDDPVEDPVDDPDRTINPKKTEDAKEETNLEDKTESTETKDEVSDTKDESTTDKTEEATDKATESADKKDNVKDDTVGEDADEPPESVDEKDNVKDDTTVEKPYDKSEEKIEYKPTDNQNNNNNNNYNNYNNNNNASTSVGEAIKEDGVDQTELETESDLDSSDIEVPEEDITKIETPKIPTTDEVKESSGGSGVIPAALGLGAAAVAGVGAAKIISDKKQKEMSLEDDYDGDSMDTEGEYSENYGDLEEYSNYSSDEDEDYGTNSQEPDFKYRAGTINREDFEGSSMANIEYEPETETDFDLEKELNNREGE